MIEAPTTFWVMPKGCPRYPVLSGHDVPAQIARLTHGRRWVVVVADENTAAYAAPIEARLQHHQLLTLRFSPGDNHKTRDQKERLEDAMLTAGVDRQALLVAVGGGVVCDLAGFVAGSYMRGIDHLNVATTLLCQVDAAIGGKTAVNTPLAKNAIGMFHHPLAVLMHHAALATLPPEELRCGLAEAIKQAALTPDDALFDELERWLAAAPSDPSPNPSQGPPPPELVLRCAAVKADIVAEDGRDHGVRQLLNFGHTVGHALERVSRHALRHGEAVAVGMYLEACVAAAEGRFPTADVTRLKKVLNSAGLPVTAHCDFDQAWPFMQRDKKNHDNTVMMAVPPTLSNRAPQHGRFTQPLSETALRKVWR